MKVSMTLEEAIAYFKARGNYNSHDGTNGSDERCAQLMLIDY